MILADLQCAWDNTHGRFVEKP